MHEEHRMHEEQTFLWPIVAVLMVVILFCSVMLVRGTGEKRRQISVIVSDSSAERWVPLKAGLTQAAKDNDIDLSYVYTDYLDDVYKQTALINQEIADGADGIITDFCLSRGTAELVRNIISRVPVEFIINNVDADADISGNYATVMTNNYEVGRAIGNELVIDYGDQLQEVRIGIVAGNQQQYAMQDRLRGFLDAVKAEAPDIVWTVEESRFLEQDIRRSMERTAADVIIGLDNTSLEAAVDYLAEVDTEHTPERMLYGAGCSEKLAYYIDNGTIASMILPNEFSIGYQSLTDLSAKLENRMLTLEDREQGFNVVHQENLFRDENQRILFPIVQ